MSLSGRKVSRASVTKGARGIKARRKVILLRDFVSLVHFLPCSAYTEGDAAILSAKGGLFMIAEKNNPAQSKETAAVLVEIAAIRRKIEL